MFKTITIGLMLTTITAQAADHGLYAAFESGYGSTQTSQESISELARLKLAIPSAYEGAILITRLGYKITPHLGIEIDQLWLYPLIVSTNSLATISLFKSSFSAGIRTFMPLTPACELFLKTSLSLTTEKWNILLYTNNIPYIHLVRSIVESLSPVSIPTMMPLHVELFKLTPSFAIGTSYKISKNCMLNVAWNHALKGQYQDFAMAPKPLQNYTIESINSFSIGISFS